MLGNINSCSQGPLHRTSLQMKSQLYENFFWIQEPQIPSRGVVCGVVCICLDASKGLKFNSFLELPVMKMFRLRPHKWPLLPDGTVSVSGNKNLWNSMATVPTCWGFSWKANDRSMCSLLHITISGILESFPSGCAHSAPRQSILFFYILGREDQEADILAVLRAYTYSWLYV